MAALLTSLSTVNAQEPADDSGLVIIDHSNDDFNVITSYSIHYTKLYDPVRSGIAAP